MEPAGSDIGAIEETVAFLDYFKELPDPRQAGKVIYPLAEVLLLCLLAVLAGAESFVDIARFGEKKIEFLRRFRPFHHGTPAHDHLGDIFAVLDAERFQRCFVDWVELKPALKNQAQKFPARGVSVRRLDHLNCLAADIRANRVFFENSLGFRLTEQIVLDDGTEAGMWMTATNKSYDFAYTLDRTGSRGRFHHLTYAVDCREDVLRAADIFLENGVYIETGPHKHAVQQTFFLYVYEPGGNRVEVANAGARLILAPDWQPIVWSEAERKKGQAWGLKTIESFHTYGTPPV